MITNFIFDRLKYNMESVSSYSPTASNSPTAKVTEVHGSVASQNRRMLVDSSVRTQTNSRMIPSADKMPIRPRDERRDDTYAVQSVRFPRVSSDVNSSFLSSRYGAHIHRTTSSYYLPATRGPTSWYQQDPSNSWYTHGDHRTADRSGLLHPRHPGGMMRAPNDYRGHPPISFGAFERSESSTLMPQNRAARFVDGNTNEPSKPKSRNVIIPRNITIPKELSLSSSGDSPAEESIGKRSIDTSNRSSDSPPASKRSRGEVLEGRFDKLDLLCSATLELGPLQENPSGCSCPKSKCIALYCDCFKAGRRCNPALCTCLNCKNTVEESGPEGARSKVSLKAPSKLFIAGNSVLNTNCLCVTSVYYC